MKHFSVLGLAALLTAAVLSSCQKQDMALPEEGESLSEETRASGDPAFRWESTVHWSNIPWYPYYSGAIKGMKVAYTSNWLYLLLRVDAKDPTIINQLKKKNEKDYYLWIYVHDPSGKQEEWYPTTTCLYEMRGWLFKKNGSMTDVRNRAAYLANADNNRVRSKVNAMDDYIYYEIAYCRSGQYAFDLLKGSRKLHIAARLENSYQKTSTSKAVRQQANASYCPSRIYQDGKLDMYYLDMTGTAASNNNKTPTDTNHCSDIGTTPMFMAYAPSYSTCPSRSDAKKLTHINCFSGKIGDDGSVEVSTSHIQNLLTLKSSNSKLKVLLTIGGAGSGDMFKTLFKKDDNLYKFCSDCDSIVKKESLVSTKNLDGYIKFNN